MVTRTIWQKWSPVKKGAAIGSGAAAMGAVATFLVMIKLLIINDWDGIYHNAGGSAGAVTGWVLLLGILALVISTMMFALLLAICVSVGAGLGWLYGKTKRSLPEPPAPPSAT